MGGRPSYLTILIAGAYVGAAFAVAACWSHGFFVMLLAAPIGGGLGGFAVAMVIQLRERVSGIRIVGASQRAPAEIKDASGRV